MSHQPAPERTGLAYLIGILGSLLIVAALVWAMQRYTQPPPLGEDRVSVRRKALADLRAAEASELETYGWVDQAKGVTRLPIAEAMKLAIKGGRLAYLAGRIPKKLYATASSPIEGIIE